MFSGALTPSDSNLSSPLSPHFSFFCEPSHPSTSLLQLQTHDLFVPRHVVDEIQESDASRNPSHPDPPHLQPIPHRVRHEPKDMIHSRPDSALLAIALLLSLRQRMIPIPLLALPQPIPVLLKRLWNLPRLDLFILLPAVPLSGHIHQRGIDDFPLVGPISPA